MCVSGSVCLHPLALRERHNGDFGVKVCECVGGQVPVCEATVRQCQTHTDTHNEVSGCVLF